MSEYNKSWLNSSSYTPKVIKKHLKVPDVVKTVTVTKEKDRYLSPDVNEHLFQKSLPVLQRFAEPTSPFTDLDEDRMLKVTLSTVILMARDQKISRGNQLWTTSYLQCIRDATGKIPHNIQLLLESLQQDV